MRTYASGYLTFGVKVGNHFKQLFEEQGAIRKFNEANGSDLTFLEAGSYQSQELFLLAWSCESAEPLAPQNLTEVLPGIQDGVRVWRGQILTFLAQHDIPRINEIGFRLIVNLDD